MSQGRLIENGGTHGILKTKRKAPVPPPKPARKGGRMGMRNTKHPGYKNVLKRPKKEIHRSSSQPMPQTKCYKGLFHVVLAFNIFLLLYGLGLAAFASWFLVKHYIGMAIFIGTKMLLASTCVLIGSGGSLALLSLCACSRTMRESRCFLGFYGTVLAVIILVLISGGAIALIFGNSIEAETSVADLETKLMAQYGVDLHLNISNRRITDAWDNVQHNLKCCGISGNINSTHSWAFWKLHSRWYFQTNERTPYVPDSCCSSNKSTCRGSIEIFGPPTKGPPVDYKYKLNKHLYTDGCYEKAIAYIKLFSYIVGIIAFAVPSLLVAGAVLIFCLCTKTPNSGTEEKPTSARQAEPEILRGFPCTDTL